MFESSEIKFGLRNIQAVVVPPTQGNPGTALNVMMDLIKKEDPSYAYAFIKEEEYNHPEILYCNIGGEKVERGMIQIAKLYYKDGTNQASCCFREPLHENNEVERVVIKSLKKSVIELSLQNGGKENPHMELQCMREFGDNVHVLKYIEALQDDDFLHIIMPHCPEGSLMYNIPGLFMVENSGTFGMTEDDAKKHFHQILKILKYLQDRGIYHRDISPENFMLYNGHLVLTNFEMAARISTDAHGQRCPIKHQGQYGNFFYQAPEVYDPNCSFDGFGADMWSATIVLYSMLTGKILYSWPSPSDLNFRYFVLARGLSTIPMNALTAEILSDVFLLGNDTNAQDALRSCARENTRISRDAMELLQNLVLIHPSSRWSLEQVMNSPWLRNDQSEKKWK